MRIHILWIALLCVACALPASAQGEPAVNLWDLEGDVDQDGMVNATDVQNVINRALGLQTHDPNAGLRPVHRYVVASPRVALSHVPPTVTADGETVVPVPCPVLGSAHNFRRPDGRIMVRLGSNVVFVLDRHIEGVWYPRACGLLSSQLVLEGTPLDAEGTPADEWVLIGHDGARGLRCGPSLGTARIGVAHRFDRAGDFLLRAKVISRAIPLPIDGTVEDPAQPGEELDPGTEVPDETTCGAAVAYDEVYVHVRVVDAEPSTEEVGQWQDIPEPVTERYGESMPHDSGPTHGQGPSGPQQQQGQ